MYDDYNARLLDVASNFQADKLGNETIEIFGDEMEKSERFQQTKIEDAGIVTWLGKHDSIAVKPLLRVFICAPEEHTSDAEVLPLPISKDSLEAIRTKWHLPTEFLRMLLSTMPIKSDFSVHLDPAYHVQGTEDDNKGRQIRSEGIMLRGGRSKDWNYCVAMTKCPRTGIINCFVHGLQEKEIAEMKKCLKESMEYAVHPMLLPLILLEWKIHYFAVLLERRAELLHKVEADTGLIHGVADKRAKNPTLRERTEKLEQIDFGLITQQLTGLLGTLYFCDLTFQVGLSSLDLVEKVSKNLHPLPECFVRRITYLKGLIAGVEDAKKLLEARTQAQVDTVNSLISQRHAEAALKESYRMRILAVVTLIFLPATAVATMFSTSFWNWGPSDDEKRHGKVVSHWVWVYFVSSIVLSGAVYLATRTMDSRERQRRDIALQANRRNSVLAIPDTKAGGTLSDAGSAV